MKTRALVLAALVLIAGAGPATAHMTTHATVEGLAERVRLLEKRDEAAAERAAAWPSSLTGDADAELVDAPRIELLEVIADLLKSYLKLARDHHAPFKAIDRMTDACW